MTQCEKILDYMKRFGSISAAEAFTDLSVMRLAARISDIEKTGVPIVRRPETGRNRYGEKTCYTRYSIGKE